VRFTRSRIIFFVVLIALSAVFIGGCRRAGTWLVKEDVPPHADAMVLLMGSFPERVLEAADLYHEGKARRMLIVYESMGPYRLLESRGAQVIRTTRQANDAAVALGIPADNITMLPGDARSTIDEAMAVREYLKETPGIDTILIVSSPAHMRRSSMTFDVALHTMPATVYVGCSPSSYSAFNPEKWWRRKEDIQSVLSEFVKICSFQLLEKKRLR
jgi:uncharacterized SAM-binding protein YcdF (DUF218 family)